MALSKLTKVQTVGIGSNIEVVGVITTGQFKSGTSNLHSSGVELTNLNVSGIATIGGNVSIGGTLTYEDVTNIDSVGIITARSNIDCNGDLDVDGHTNLDNVSIVGVSTFTGNIIVDSGTVRCNDGFSSDVDLFLNADANNNGTGSIIFKESGSEKLRIDSAGRCIVGGGTHAGGSALVVKGGNQNTYSTIGMFSNHTNPAVNTLLTQIRFGSNTSAVGADIRVHADADWGTNDYPSRIGFYTAPDGTDSRHERLRIDSSGRLLLGTTDIGYASFADNLTIADSANCGITLRSGTSNQGNIYFSDGTGTSADTYRGYITYAHADNYMQFATNAAERVRIKSNGYVGINNSGPERFLSVKETNNKASIFIWRTSESNGDYSGIDFSGHPSNNGTNYQKGGIYWQTDGSGFGRGDMVFCNDGAADADNVIISNEKLRIHKEGPVTKPNMPVASMSDTRATDVSNAILTSSNFYNYQWWNEGSHFNASNGRFTCPVDGVYRIYFRATTDQSQHTNVRLRKNGATINEAYANGTSGTTHSDSSEAVIHCSANDYLDIQASRLKASGGNQHKQVTFQLLH